MKYSNVAVLKELRRIQICLNLPYSREDGIENIRKCVYNNSNAGILHFLSEQKLVNMNNTSDNVRLPFINAYGNDFLKRSLVSCFFEDHKEIIGILGSIATIAGLILTR